jgi:hypothetical protein
VEYGLPVGEIPGFAEEREAVTNMSLNSEDRGELALIDECAVETLLKTNFVDSCWLKNNPTHPLSDWWWHLGKLRAGTYPAQLLPPHLQEIYQPTEQRLAA